jgi:hypothetical protein
MAVPLKIRTDLVSLTQVLVQELLKLVSIPIRFFLVSIPTYLTVIFANFFILKRKSLVLKFTKIRALSPVTRMTLPRRSWCLMILRTSPLKRPNTSSRKDSPVPCSGNCLLTRSEPIHLLGLLHVEWALLTKRPTIFSAALP